MLGKSFNLLLSHGADAEALARIKNEFEGTSDKGTSYSGAEILYRRKDGTDFWAAVFISPVRDVHGDIVQYFASFVDLTKHKEDEAKSRLLIDELNHRVKNTLSRVQSIVWQAMRTGTDPKAIQEAVESRLSALSRSHDLLTRENWESAGLFDIIHDALAPFAVADGGAERIVIKGENIRFSPQSALALGIVFNELATNAVKYGALSNEAGSILIEWKKESAADGDRVLLNWRENGGPPVTAPTRKGFGSRVIERGLSQVEGAAHLDYRPEGVTCTMTMKIQKGASGG